MPVPSLASYKGREEDAGPGSTPDCSEEQVGRHRTLHMPHLVSCPVKTQGGDQSGCRHTYLHLAKAEKPLTCVSKV